MLGTAATSDNSSIPDAIQARRTTMMEGLGSKGGKQLQSSRLDDRLCVFLRELPVAVGFGQVSAAFGAMAKLKRTAYAGHH